MLPRVILALPLALATALSAAAQTSSATDRRGSLLVLAKKDHALAIVDPATLKVLARVPVGNDPHEVIASADGRTAYVSNYGFGAYNTLALVDLAARKPLPAIDLGPLRGPHGLTFIDGKVWFTAEAAKAIGRYDPRTHKVDWILGTGQNRTHMLFVAPDLRYIITSNVNSATISLFEEAAVPLPGAPGGPPPVPESTALTAATAALPVSGPPKLPPPPPGPPRRDWSQTIVPVGRGSEGFDVSPSGAEIWVANADDHTLSIIAVATKRVVATLPDSIEHANRLKFTVDGRHVLVSSLGGTALTVYDAASRKPIKQLELGRGAAGILMEPSGNRAFIACSPDNYVAVLDLHTLEIVGRIDAGVEPDGLAWATHP